LCFCKTLGLNIAKLPPLYVPPVQLKHKKIKINKNFHMELPTIFFRILSFFLEGKYLRGNLVVFEKWRRSHFRCSLSMSKVLELNNKFGKTGDHTGGYQTNV
jgi:hypothetical protein